MWLWFRLSIRTHLHIHLMFCGGNFMTRTVCYYNGDLLKRFSIVILQEKKKTTKNKTTRQNIHIADQYSLKCIMRVLSFQVMAFHKLHFMSSLIVLIYHLSVTISYTVWFNITLSFILIHLGLQRAASMSSCLLNTIIVITSIILIAHVWPSSSSLIW